MGSQEEKKSWSIVKRAQSFTHAFRGLRLFFTMTPNALVHVFALILVVFFGFYFKISPAEWIALVLVMGLVFITEALNTAIEIDINLTSPEFHPYARDTKDVAAGAVLLAAFISLIVGFIIFLPKVILYVNM